MIKKQVVLLAGFLLLVVFVPFGKYEGVAAGETAVSQPPPFLIQANHTIQAGNQTFPNLATYVQSDYFQQNGLRCGTQTPPELLTQTATPGDCTLSQTILQSEYWLGTQTYLIIPVVFHVITKSDGTGNLSDQTIRDQIDVLNRDFAGMDASVVGTDVRVQFKLEAITRTTNDSWFNDTSEFAYKSALAWDPNKYLNIYSNAASGYLGYAYFPQSAAGTWYDGVVVLYQAVGGRNQGFYPYDQGRTLVHEIGHYLGLYHTFEGGGCYSGYTGGDLIDDTNSENTAHYSCSAPSSSCGTPDPLDNFMNYTNDACMTRFTHEQANRMVCSILNYRPQLYTRIDLFALTERTYLPAVSR
ncbi:MAG: hypothetical protein Kow0080_18140 [Candidatus Promineifilaceae bacterium]